MLIPDDGGTDNRGTEAAAGADDAPEMGERVRRKLKYLGAERELRRPHIANWTR